MTGEPRSRFHTEIDMSLVKIKKGNLIATKKIWNLWYGEQNELIVVESPTMTVADFAQINNTRFLRCLLSCCHTEFVEWIRSFESIVFDRISKHTNYINFKSRSNIVHNQAFGSCVNLNFVPLQVVFFDHKQDVIPFVDALLNLKPSNPIKVLMCIKFAYTTQTHFGIEVQPMQIKIMPPILTTRLALFKDFSSYHKMHAVKIPIGAIECKMKMDGCNNNDIDHFKKSIVSETTQPKSMLFETISMNKLAPSKSFPCPPLPPPPPPPPPPSLLPLPRPQPPRIQTQRQHVTQPPTTPKVNVVPSLHDILSAKNKLRKTVSDN